MDVRDIYDLAETVIDESPLGACWEWTRGRTKAGYGSVWADGKVQYAHRVIYELAVGPIPEGLEIDHLCRVRHCVRPSHLEAVTHAENMRRAVFPKDLGLTHCKNGHELTEENSYYWPHRPGRVCKTCRRAATYRHRDRTRKHRR